MNAPSIDIKDMLEAESSFTGTIFIGSEPATPNESVTIFDTTSYPPMLTFNKEEKYEFPSVQFRVRSVSYQTGWALCSLIKDLLHGRANESWNGAFYTLIKCQNGPYFMDWDLKQRVRFVLNFEIQRR